MSNYSISSLNENHPQVELQLLQHLTIYASVWMTEKQINGTEDFIFVKRCKMLMSVKKRMIIKLCYVCPSWVSSVSQKFMYA